MPDHITGVLLMSFGAAATPQDVPGYLASVRGGSPSTALVAEFQKRYRLAGGSPLVRNTWAQASALEHLLGSGERNPSSSLPLAEPASPVPTSSTTPPPRSFLVGVGMRHSPPFIRDGLSHLVQRGATRIVGLVLSPQYSPYIMGGYHRALDEAQAIVAPDMPVRVAGPWHTLPALIDALACRVLEALGACTLAGQEEVAILMTAHSLPKTVADHEPDYLEQLRTTAVLVARRANLAPHRWQFAYQSAGHTPQEWLRPDIKELFPRLREDGYRRVLVAPIQFLSDHLEVLYDIDVAARQQAEEQALDLMRIRMPGVMPQLIEALAQVVHREPASRSSFVDGS